MTPTLSFDANNLFLSLILPANAFRSAGQTANQRSVGGALDAIAASGNVGGLVTAMANLPTSQGASALQALSGQPYADFGTVNVRGSQLFMNAIGRQMAVERGAGLGGAKSVALAEACADVCDAGTATPSRFRCLVQRHRQHRQRAGRQQCRGPHLYPGRHRLRHRLSLDPRLLFGIAGGYVGGTQWVNGFSGTGNVDALSVALYGSFTAGRVLRRCAGGLRQRPQPHAARGVASRASSHRHRQRRCQMQPVPRPDRDRLQVRPRLSGEDLDHPRSAACRSASSTQAGFSESGSNLFNLAFPVAATTSVRTTFGADFAASFDLGGGRPLDIGLRLGWLHEFADTARPITAAFSAAPGQPFTVSGATPQRDSAVVGFSAAAPISDRASLFASYDGEVGGGTDNHAVRLGFRLTW